MGRGDRVSVSYMHIMYNDQCRKALRAEAKHVLEVSERNSVTAFFCGQAG